MKICSSCKIRKDKSEFTKLASSKDGLHHDCKDCKRGKHNQWRRDNPEKTKGYEDGRKDWKAEYQLKRRYNITKKDYNKMLDSQNGGCDICGNKETRKNNGKLTKLSVDHNHITGKVRGLLCCRCNLLVSDKMQELSRKADEYLIKYDSVVETKA